MLLTTPVIDVRGRVERAKLHSRSTRRHTGWLLCAAMLFGGANARAEVVVESCDERILRFFAAPEARNDVQPSLSLQHELQCAGTALDRTAVVPEFREINGRHAVVIEIDAGTSLYGTGEVAGPLLRNGRRVTAWNYDAYGYGDHTPHLYQSHPWVLAVRADGSAFGILADTSYRCHIDLTRDIVIIADGPSFPVIVIERETPQAVVQGLADLTGHMPLPPKWALGYHQCRYSYYPDARVREIAYEFRKRKIPCDVLWLDIDYMDGFRSFTFSPQYFPEPGQLVDDLHAQSFRAVAIIDPGIKVEPGYFVFDSGTTINAWVKTSSGRPYVGRVWPGDCVFPDFTNARVRQWWASLYRGFLASGIDGIWNDMNEPAIFNVDSKTMPLTNLHEADDEIGGPDTHARYHNVYGMLMARATRAGIRATRPERRPFVLTRANFLGGQREAATWTGDNTASWYHLDVSIPMVLNLGLSGQPFAGPDIGGFALAGEPEMFARWMGFGALLPFARGHTGKGNIDKEPWAFGKEIETTCRLALQRRYRLMPYLYTLFWKASETGMPVAQPLFFADPTDASLREVDDTFLLGSDVAVVVQTDPRRKRQPVLPRGNWLLFDLELGDAGDADLPDLYLRPGSIVPVGPVMQYVDEVPTDPLELLISLDEEGRAEGVLYEDAGDGHVHRDGEFRLIRYEARLEGEWITVSSKIEAGAWSHPIRNIKIRCFTRDQEVKAAGRSGQSLRFRLPSR